jgi:hypothetical protein
MHAVKSANLRLLPVAYFFALFLVAPRVPASVSQQDDPLGTALEAARKTHDENQLQSLKTEPTSWFASGSLNHELFVTQGDKGVEVSRAARWKETRCQANNEKNERDTTVRQGVARRNAGELACQEARQAKADQHANTDANGD